MNLWSNVIQAWYSIVFCEQPRRHGAPLSRADSPASPVPATDVPRFHKGWIATIVVAVLTVAIALVTRHLDYREQRQRRQDEQQPTSPSEGKTAEQEAELA